MSENMLPLVADIVKAYVSNHKLEVSQVSDLIQEISKCFLTLKSQPPEISEKKAIPAVPVTKSVFNDYIVCLEDGRRLKMLKRYLHTNFKMTPEEYRRKWGLPAHYPMVAPAYAKIRSSLAKDSKLGHPTNRPVAKKANAHT